jgi:hypothetical protein
LYSNTTGYGNVADGYQALTNNNTGTYNVSSGYQALYANSTGSNNNAVGNQTMFSNTVGHNNVALGRQALDDNTTGYYNVAIGSLALRTNSTGFYNTAIGATADVGSSSVVNGTAVGYGAIVASSNAIQLGNSSVLNVSTYGTITSGAITYPNTAGTSGYYLTTNGANAASWTPLPVTTSSAFVGLGTDVTLENLKVRLAATGNISLQISAVSGTTYAVYGSQVKVVGGVIGSSYIDGASQLAVNTTPVYLKASDSFLNAGDVSTWTIMDPAAGMAWRITAIIGQTYQVNLIKIEKL